MAPLPIGQESPLADRIVLGCLPGPADPQAVALALQGTEGGRPGPRSWPPNATGHPHDVRSAAVDWRRSAVARRQVPPPVDGTPGGSAAARRSTGASRHERPERRDRPARRSAPAPPRGRGTGRRWSSPAAAGRRPLRRAARAAARIPRRPPGSHGGRMRPSRPPSPAAAAERSAASRCGSDRPLRPRPPGSRRPPGRTTR